MLHLPLQLNPFDKASASHLSPDQRAYYQELLWAAVQKKAGLRLDATNQTIFIREEAEVSARIALLNQLLEEDTNLINKGN